jgi:hypothetical protein
MAKHNKEVAKNKSDWKKWRSEMLRIGDDVPPKSVVRRMEAEMNRLDAEDARLATQESALHDRFKKHANETGDFAANQRRD